MYPKFYVTNWIIMAIVVLIVLIVNCRDVNFVFFQKSIIVLKKSIFFDYQIWGRYLAMPRLLCNVPPRHAVVPGSARTQ